MLEWAASPCSSCLDSPCCRRLALEHLRIRTRADIRRAALILEQRWFELGLKADGSWTLFYVRPCRRLDPASSRCLVHRKGQPAICRDFGASLCWYRRVFGEGDSLEFIRFDALRLRRLEGMLAYDQDSAEIAGVPAWEELLSMAAGRPLSDPGLRADGGRPVRLWFGCPPPSGPRHLELFSFRRVFPGVSVEADEKAWYTVVESVAPAGLADPEGLLREYCRPAGRRRRVND